MYEIVDGWLCKDGVKVPAELVMIYRREVESCAYIRNPQSIENLAVIDAFLYQCMLTHSSMRERKGK